MRIIINYINFSYKAITDYTVTVATVKPETLAGEEKL